MEGSTRSTLTYQLDQIQEEFKKKNFEECYSKFKEYLEDFDDDIKKVSRGSSMKNVKLEDKKIVTQHFTKLRAILNVMYERLDVFPKLYDEEKDVFACGKYKDLSAKEVYSTDPSYMAWAVKKDKELNAILNKLKKKEKKRENSKSPSRGRNKKKKSL